MDVHRRAVRISWPERKLDDGSGLVPYASTNSYTAYVTDTVQEITGTPARTFADWTQDNAAGFSASTE